MTRRIQLRRDTTTNWEGADPVLAAGEVGVDLTTGQIKIGDGTLSWTELSYYTGSDVDLEGYATEEYVDGAIGAIEIPNVSNFITAEDIPAIPADISDLTDTEGLLGQGGSGSTVLPYIELTNSPFIVQSAELGTPVSFTRTAEGSETDTIDTGLTLARGINGALYNAELELEYDRDNHTSPAGTEWNSDGWGDLLNLHARSYTTFYEALGRAIGNNIIGSELVMHDTINDRYYKFSFSDWGQNNGGSFAYTRTSVEDPNYFKKADYATANNVDVIEDDSTLQVGITRGNNGGIYNPFTEEGWDSDVSPEGTVWNIDGWDDLSDVETRTYTNFYAAYNGNLGERVPGSRAILYVPSIEKYYAVQWISWTQNNQGGGFSYLRYALDLDQLQEGVKFADGTVQKTAYVSTNVKSTASRGRRIEEVVGNKTVSVTAPSDVFSQSGVLAARPGEAPAWDLFIDLESYPDISSALEQYSRYSNDDGYWQITVNGTDYKNSVEVYVSGDNQYFIVYTGGVFVNYSEGDSFVLSRVTGGTPVVWWNKNELPSGGSNFRGAIIDFHAYTGESTIIGTIHIVDDDGEEHISHIEVQSGSTDGENDDLWYVTDEGRIKYRRIDGESKTLRVHWIAKVFYGSELYD